jgi:hypothetical protein
VKQLSTKEVKMASDWTEGKRRRDESDGNKVEIIDEEVDLSGISKAQFLQIAKNVVNLCATRGWLATGPPLSLPGLSAVRNYAADAETVKEPEKPLTGAPASYTAEAKKKAEQVLLAAAKGNEPA